jgi:coiled-coil domain-containing protein 130
MQGFNMGRYVPPELEGTMSANKVAGKHALGKRANKIKEGILTVRFEMPYAVWCNHCPKPTIIGQGVRFNAEKKKVGNYLSTPIYSFRMKHPACGGWIEIHTDPKNTAYVVTEGGKARDFGEDRVREGEEGVPILSAEERERRRQDAFAVLEDKKQDKVQEKEQGKRIIELLEVRDQHWDDPYEANKRLRKTFRTERKVREKEHDYSEKLRDRMGLDVELMPENDEDRRHATLIEFGGLADEDINASAMRVTSRPLFQQEEKAETTKVKAKVSQRAKAAAEVERRKKILQQEVQDNSRAAADPFLSFGNTETRTFRAIAGIKRKAQSNSAEQKEPEEKEKTEKLEKSQPTSALSLVTYDSD